MIEAAVSSIEPGVTAEQIAAVVDQAVMSAVEAATPAAMPAEAPGPGMGMMSSGTLDFGVGDIGAEVYVIANEAYQATVYNGRVTHEHMFGSDLDGNVIPRLVASFEDTSNTDGTWSRIFNLQEGGKVARPLRRLGRVQRRRLHIQYGQRGHRGLRPHQLRAASVASLRATAVPWRKSTNTPSS